MREYDFADNQKYVFFTIPKNLKETFFKGTYFNDCSKIDS